MTCKCEKNSDKANETIIESLIGQLGIYKNFLNKVQDHDEDIYLKLWKECLSEATHKLEESRK